MNYDLQTDQQNVFFRCVEDSNEAIMITNMRGNLVYVNPAWTAVYKYTREEAIGQNPRILHSGMQSPEFYRSIWVAILDPELGHWKGELTNRAKDGTLVPVLLSITPFRAPDHTIIGYMGRALDMTGQKDLEAKILQQDRLASVGMLASGLAHEVGTPLGIVRGRAELLQMLVGDNQTVRSGLEVIVTQIDRISKLITALLRFSRGSDQVELRPTEILKVVNEVLALIGGNFRQDSIELKIEVPPGLKASADFSHLEQIILNFAVNAAHAIQKAIKDGRSSGHAMTVRAVEVADHVILSVTDTGCGITTEHRRRLFQPFFTTKDVGQGTGLGLAIVAKLVSEMNGEITLDSVLNQGTTFSVRLNKA
ncbi:MAG TPA: ATP-binding protein [Oligoflexia bacterium]|nr:ATP-binding protein [Oligoflexia bacterium]